MPFVKGKSGNPSGKSIGKKSKKTLEWESLAVSITGKQADLFQKYMTDLWKSDQPKEKQLAAELFLQTLEYFKPKHARTEVKQDGVQEVTIRVIEG